MMYFHDIEDGKYYPADECPIVEPGVTLTGGTYYRVGELMYPYLGKALKKEATVYFEQNYPGGFYEYNGTFKIIPWTTKEDLERYSIRHLSNKDYSSQLYDETITPEQAVEQYVSAFEKGDNLSESVKVKENLNGAMYIPVFREMDNGVERILKRMIVAMEIRSTEYRKKVKDDYMYDNLVSSLDAATRHTSIVKIIDWFTLLGLKWEFSVFSKDPNVEYALKEPISATDENPSPYIEFHAADCSKDAFVVDLTEGEDPYKRIIKLALYKTQIPKITYRRKGSTAHQINNLMSALKNKQKMAADYFEMWCELLKLEWICRIEDPTSGIWYQANGYQITTNNPRDEELRKYEQY